MPLLLELISEDAKEKLEALKKKLKEKESATIRRNSKGKGYWL